MLSDVHLRDTASHADDPVLLAALRELAGRAPGRLVLNGDFFDFVKVTAVPEDPRTFLRPITASEHLYGLGPGEDRSAWKAARILDANPAVVGALKRLVSDGHEIVFVPGNHDAELRYPAVRAEILRRFDASETGAVVFSAWFYHERGRVWIEHGSQYDRENALPDVTSPDATRKMPFGIVSSRYFANIIERRCGLPPSDMGPGGYFVWVFKNHGMMAFAAIARYFVFAAICLLSSGPFWRRRKGETDAPRVRTAPDVPHFGLDPGLEARIDALKAAPLLGSFRRTLMRLYLPQVGLTVAAWAASLAIAVLLPAWWWAGVSAVLGSIALLALSRRAYTGRIRAGLEDAAGAIGRILGIRCVVFGHDHNGVQSRSAPGNFVSSVWRFAGGPGRILEIPADDPNPRVILVNP